MRPRTLVKGERLFEQGEPGSALVVLAHGRLVVLVRDERGNERPISSVEPGEVVGEMACIDPAPRSATVRAELPSLVHELDRHVLEFLRHQAPGAVAAVVGSVIGQLTTRLRAATERIEVELRRLAGERGGAPTEAHPPRLASGSPPGRYQGRLQLRDLAPSSGLTVADLQRLVKVAPARTWPDRALLCHEGDRGQSCFLVVQGEIDVVRSMRGKRRRLATLPPGSTVGQMALVDDAPRSASLRARGDVVALELHRSTFERLLAQASPLALRFQEEIAVAGIRQLRKANGRLATLIGRRPGERSQARRAPSTRRSHRRTGPRQPPHTTPSREDTTCFEDPLAYVQTALNEWGMNMEQLEALEVVHPEGLAHASEGKSRKKRD